jgi:putative radical SAM enzyme (TIGR03279 family)
LIEIVDVLPDSTAAKYGLKRGDRIVSVNGRAIRDSIDFQFLASDERLSLQVRKPDGTLRTIRIVKEPDDTLGIQFGPFTIRQCRNKCIFCFVDQMPQGCRKSLYVRDDDFRASFLYGNYITLTNLREEDWERIFSQRLSPLYISVHTTDPVLRTAIMRSRTSPDILASLKRLAAAGIRMHTQIVLCPGINDGQHLVRTIEDLAGLFPAVQSIAVVPVGLTSHRRGLYRLRAFRKSEARRVIASVQQLSDRYKRRFRTRLVFPSDELYIQAGMVVPPLSSYEDLPQIENGVGMVAQFLADAKRTRLPSRVPPMRITVVTGVSFAPILRRVLARLRQVPGASVRQITAKNSLFGPSVTVAGLLAGKDILQAIKGKRLGSVLVIPANALKEDEGLFLDSLKLADVEAAAGVPIRTVNTFSDLVGLLKTPGTHLRKRSMP